jgi:tetratricopeptide (TPR) repeat protein
MFYGLSWLLYDPFFLAIGLGVVAYLLIGQARGRYWNPLAWFERRRKIGKLNDLLVTNPHDMTARLDCGRLLVESRRWAEARSQLQPVVESRNTSAEGWYFWGRALLGLGQLEEGEAAIRKALELRRDLLVGEPWYALAQHHYARKEYSLALPFFEELVAANSSHSEGYYKLGDCLNEAGRAEEARQAWTEAIEAHKAAPRYKRRVNRPWKWRAQLALARA